MPRNRAPKLKNLPPALPLPPEEKPGKTFWERRLWDVGLEWVAGIDEAGRGSWAGPVVAAAVVFKSGTEIPEIDDSKKILPARREILFDIILNEALDYGVGVVGPEVIDEINILQATFQAMRLAVCNLKVKPQYLLIDGNRGIGISIPQKMLVGGDGCSLSIGAASILAKVTRDRLMGDMEKKYPQYRFSVHKGYGTSQHQEELKTHGPLPCHRKSFAPIREMEGETR